MECQFSEPIDINPSGTPQFSFSQSQCTTTAGQLIVNPTYPERNFYIDKSFSLGDLMIIFFLTLFLFFYIGKIIYNFFWRR